jgi:hypothetical protein
MPVPSNSFWWCRALGATALAALLCVAVAPVASANMGVPTFPGDAAGEPAAALAEVDVVRETLVFDLAPLAAAEPAQVRATYRVYNDGPEARLDLTFVAPGLAGDTGSVVVDGRAVPAQPVDSAALPAAWRPPRVTPSVSQMGGTLDYAVRRDAAGGLRFGLALAPGEHDVVVSYDTRPGEYHSTEAYRTHQIGYVLAPARTWRSFGKLDVEVRLPRGWEAAASLPLAREGDVRRGAIDGVPADTLGIAARHPAPARADTGLATGAAAIGWLAGLAGAAVAGVLTGARAARRSWGWGRTLAAAGVAALGALLAAAGPLLGYSAWLGSLALDQTEVSRYWNYRGGLAPLALARVGLVAGAPVSAAALMLRARRRRGAPKRTGAPRGASSTGTVGPQTAHQAMSAPRGAETPPAVPADSAAPTAGGRAEPWTSPQTYRAPRSASCSGRPTPWQPSARRSSVPSSPPYGRSAGAAVPVSK